MNAIPNLSNRDDILNSYLMIQPLGSVISHRWLLTERSEVPFPALPWGLSW